MRLGATMISLSLLAAAGRCPAQAFRDVRTAERVAGVISSVLPNADPLASPELPPPPPVEGFRVAQGPLFTPELWSALAAPDAATLSWLAARVPELKTAEVRELTPEAIDALLADSAARGLSPTDLFSDAGLMGEQVFYAGPTAIASAFAAYEIPVLTLAAGRSTDGKAFRLQALLLGGRGVEMLYDRAKDFRIQNPYFDDYEYTLANRVSYRIQGPGDMTVNGITVEMGLVRPKIRRFVHVATGRIRVETSWGSRERPVRPIRRASP